MSYTVLDAVCDHFDYDVPNTPCPTIKQIEEVLRVLGLETHIRMKHIAVLVHDKRVR